MVRRHGNTHGLPALGSRSGVKGSLMRDTPYRLRQLMGAMGLGMARGICFGLIVAGVLFCSRTTVRAQSRLLTEFTMDDLTVEVPFVYSQHQIIVHGEAANKKDLTLLFDTGASVPVFDSSLDLPAQEGYNFPDSVIQEADGNSRAHAILLSDLTVGQDGHTVHARNLGVLVSDLSQVSKVMGRKIDGIVGLSFMAGFVAEIDYGKKNLRFYSPRRFTVADRKPDNQSTFLFALSDTDPKRPTSNLLVSGKLISDYDYDFILDTGFGGYVSVARGAAQLSGLLKNETARIASESYSVSHRFHTEKIRASFLTLGEINLSNRIIQVDTRNGDTYGQNGIIGNRLLQNYRVTLDYARHKLWLERMTTKEEPDEAAKPTLGLTVRTDGGVIHVVKVAPASPAERAGVQNGDTILRIAGVAIAAIGMDTAISVLASPDGPTELEVQHDDASAPENRTPVTLKLIPSSPLDWKSD